MSGEPEPWEAELLFTEQAQHAMRELYSDGPDLVARVARWYGLPEAP